MLCRLYTGISWTTAAYRGQMLHHLQTDRECHTGIFQKLLLLHGTLWRQKDIVHSDFSNHM